MEHRFTGNEPKGDNVVSMSEYRQRRARPEVNKVIPPTRQSPRPAPTKPRLVQTPVKYLEFGKGEGHGTQNIYTLPELQQVEVKLDQYLQALSKTIGSIPTHHLAKELEKSIRIVVDISYATGLADGFLVSDDL